MLNAIIEINPDARKIAQSLDSWFNKTGKLKGPLHGVPILIKDNIATGDKMNTTAGTWALLGAKPKRDARVVSKLRKAGAIILGKTNMSELAGVSAGVIPLAPTQDSFHLGLVRFPTSKSVEVKLQMSILEQKLKNLAYKKIRATDVVLSIQGISFEKALNVYLTEFKHHFNEYLAKETLPNQPIRSLEDVIEFNMNHSHLYPSGLKQGLLIKSQSTTGIDDPQYLKDRDENQLTAKSLIDNLLKANQLDALITLSHPALASSVPSSIAGYPIITIPLGIANDGLPFGASIYSKWGYEHVIYSVAHALDPDTSARKPPKFLQ
ncbi:hypothetical protein L0F63_004223 [Massospora cicadina]|nr:hypothetical protein L0F63_004223 [Massospora cicadina]